MSCHYLLSPLLLFTINGRENRRGNPEWTIQEIPEILGTQDEDKNKQNKNTTQYVLDTTMRKQTHI